MLKITVAGASGFIGSNLIAKLSKEYLVKALSRSTKSSDSETIEWQKADLFSLKSTADALDETDIAIYLVHSMMPSSRLFQGSFHDTDLMLADNFIRACKTNRVKQIIYLGGVVPQGEMSDHLESRKEVEDVLKSSGIPLTILRAGLVVGNGGSSYEILKNLVFNLPLMVLPQWTKNETPIIYVDDLTEILKQAVDNPVFFNKTLDAVCGEPLKYSELIAQTAKHIKKNIPLIPVPINYTSFSKLWVSIFGRADYSLTSPLVDSLICDFSSIKPDDMIQDLIIHKTYQSMLPHIEVKQKKKRKRKKLYENNTVRSIQRLTMNSRYSADEVADFYLRWLPRVMRSVIWVKREVEPSISIRIIGIRSPLLVINYEPSPEDKAHEKFHVVGGMLSKTTNTGWLEFRSINSGQYLIASLNEFIPSLPWFIYKITQAPAHKLTMSVFGKFLETSEASKNQRMPQCAEDDASKKAPEVAVHD